MGRMPGVIGEQHEDEIARRAQQAELDNAEETEEGDEDENDGGELASEGPEDEEI